MNFSCKPSGRSLRCALQQCDFVGRSVCFLGLTPVNLGGALTSRHFLGKYPSDTGARPVARLSDGPTRRRSTSQRCDPGSPHAAGPLEDRDKILRAAVRHHAIKIGELDRADASGQGGVQASFPLDITSSRVKPRAGDYRLLRGSLLSSVYPRSQSNKGVNKMTDLIQLNDVEIAAVAGGYDIYQSASVYASQSNYSSVSQSAYATNYGDVSASNGAGSGNVAAAVGASASNTAIVTQVNAALALNRIS